MADERVLRAILRFGLDKQSAEQVKKGTLGIKDALVKVQQQAKATQDEMNRVREKAERLGSVSMSMAGVGGAIVGSLALAASKYVASAGQAESSSRRWLAATKDLESAQIRVGRVAAEAILPALETAAEVAEKASKFVEDHPDLVANALKIGTVVAGLGAVGLAVSRGIRLVADVKSVAAAATEMIAAKLMNSAADKNLAAAGIMGKSGLLGAVGGLLGKSLIPGAARAVGTTMAARFAMASGTTAATAFGVPLTAAGGVTGASLAAALTGGTLLGGIGLGLGGNELLARSQWGQQHGIQTTGKWATVGAYGLGKLFGGEEQGLRWAEQVARALGEIKDRAEGAAPALDEFADKLKNSANHDSAVQAYAQYQSDMAHLDEQHEAERRDILDRYGRQRAELERQFEAERTRLVADGLARLAQMDAQYQQDSARRAQEYAQTQAQAETDYRARRADLAKGLARELKQMAHDYERQRQELARSHAERMEDLTASRDALGLAREARRYQQEQQQAAQDYADQRQQAREAQQQQLADLAADYAAQRQAAQAQYQQAQADAQAQYEDERQAAQDAQAQALADLEQSHRDAKQENSRAQADALTQLEQHYRAEHTARQQAFEDQLHQLGLYNDRQLEKYQAFYTQMEQGLVNFMNQVGSYTPGWAPLTAQGFGNTPTGGAASGGRASGGYAGYGRYWLGEEGREFVLSAESTRAAERAVGGLTQERILAGLGGGRGPVVQVYQTNWRFAGALTESEREGYRRMAAEAAETSILAVFPAR
jgi:hypothetical protein